MAEEFKVSIGAEIKDFDDKLSKASKSLNDFGKTAKRDLKTFNKETTKAGKGMSNLGKGTANALPSLNEFSRVIQDAPFGIQGVANNITQLTTQFQYLSKNAGGTGAALKAMLGSLTGPAGMLLAISAITSAMVAYGDKMNFSKVATDGLAKATKEFLSEAQSEITTINQLLSISRDEANSKKVRQKAVDRLNEKYPQYLGNLTLESVKTDKVTKSVNRLSESLIQKAKIEGLQALITKKTSNSAEDLIDLDLERIKTTEKIIKTIKKLNDKGLTKINIDSLNSQEGLTKGIEESNAALSKYSGGYTRLERELQSSTGRFEDLGKKIQGIKDKTDESLKPLLKLQSALKVDLFGDEPDKKTKPTKGGAVTTTFDVDISKAEAKIAKINFALTNISGKERFAEMTKLFKSESDLIIANYKKQVSLAGTNKNALKVAENEKTTALLELKAKFNNDLLSLSKSNIKNELDLIKSGASIEKNERLKALTEQFNQLGALTQVKAKELASKKKAIEVDANNNSLLKQNEFLNKMLANENLNGELRVAIEKQIQANLANIRGEANLNTLEKAKTFQEELNEVMSISGNDIQGFATGLGEALGQGGNVISSIGGALINQLSGFLSEMGALLIKYGTLAVLKGKLDLAINAGGITSIGAGIAAIAVGVALTAAGSALGNRSTGGSSSSNASSGSDYSSGGSSYSSSSGSASSGTYVFEIQGTKLVGVLKNTLNRNKSLGGNLSFS